MKKYIFEDKYADGIYHIDVSHTTVSESFQPHGHNLCELVYITGGRGVHNIDSKEYEIASGDVFVISGKTIHGFERCESLGMYNMVYPPNVLSNILIDIKELPGFHSLFGTNADSYEKDFSQHIKLNLYRQKEAGQLFEKIIKLQAQKTAGYRTLIYSLFLELIYLFSIAFAEDTGSGDARSTPIAEILAFIEQNYSRKITCEDIADHCGFSSRHISRLFGAELGMTPVEYIMELRLKKSLELILQTQFSATHIAYECGFSDSNYFIKCFKKKYGCTPGTLRQ